MKFIKLCIIYPIIACAFMYLGLVLINLYDEPPSVLADKFERAFQQYAEDSHNDNAFPYFYGFRSERTKDARAEGLRYIEWVNIESQTPDPEFSYDDPFLEEDIFWHDDKPSCHISQKLMTSCVNSDSHCKVFLKENRQKLAELTEEHEWLIDRYQNLITYSNWSETVNYTIETPLPPYLEVNRAQKLFLLKLWLNTENQPVDIIQAQLEQDLVFWRMLLKSSDILLTKLIVTRTIQQHFSWGTLILQDLPQEQLLPLAPNSWKKPFSPGEQSFDRVMVGEWYFYKNISELMLKHPIQQYEYSEWWQNKFIWPILKPLYQHQASLNSLALKNDHLSKVFSYPPIEFENAVNLLHQNKTKPTSLNSKLYNLTDKYFIQISDFYDQSDWYAKVTGLEGIRRLALLAIDIEKNQKPDNIAPAVKKSSQKNPYTNEAFDVDTTQQALVFKGMPGSSVEPFYLYLK